jgi:hypothetical protein
MMTYCWGEDASSSVYDVHRYALIGKFLYYIFKHTYTGVFVRRVAYTSNGVPWLEVQMDGLYLHAGLWVFLEPRA